jgi:hypothetical protein
MKSFIRHFERTANSDQKKRKTSSRGFEATVPASLTLEVPYCFDVFHPYHLSSRNEVS